MITGYDSIMNGVRDKSKMIKKTKTRQDELVEALEGMLVLQGYQSQLLTFAIKQAREGRPAGARKLRPKPTRPRA